VISRDRTSAYAIEGELGPPMVPGGAAPAGFDLTAMIGAVDRSQMLATLAATIEETVKLRSSCGFVLAAIDHLGRINDAYGFDVADEVIAAVAKRMQSQLRGKDHLGHLSGNKIGVILHNCTPDDLMIASDRLLVGVRNEVVQTSAGPVAATVTIGASRFRAMPAA